VGNDRSVISRGRSPWRIMTIVAPSLRCLYEHRLDAPETRALPHALRGMGGAWDIVGDYEKTTMKPIEDAISDGLPTVEQIIR
jgi:hypothetical protein